MSSTFRKILREIHLWLGLASGIVLFVVCFTGTVLVYEKEIKSLISEKPAPIAHATGQEPLALDSLRLLIAAEYDRRIRNVMLPATGEEAVVFSLQPEKGQRRGKRISVNPYTGKQLSSQSQKGGKFFMTMFRLHRWLLLDTKIGRPIVGVSTIIFVILCFSGLLLWWPKKWRKRKQWRKGFRIKANGTAYRLIYDLHNTLGFYALIVLLVMGLTGLNWSFPWYRDAMSATLGSRVFSSGVQAPNLGEEQFENTISLDEALAQANTVLGYDGMNYINLPSKPGAVIEVLRKKKGWSSINAYDRVYLHPADGRVLKVALFKELSFGQQLAATNKALHLGDIYGQLSKLIYFISCLIATSLPVTGTLIWWKKLRKKSAKRKKKALKAKAKVNTI